MKPKRKGRHDREGGGGGKGGVQRAQTLATQALDLRIAGTEYRAIAAQLGVSLSIAHKYVHQEMARVAELNRGKAEELREIELAKLDAIERDMRPRSERGDANAAGVLVRVSMQRAKLCGLEAPTKIEHTGSVDVAALSERIAALAAGAVAGVDADGAGASPGSVDAGRAPSD